MSAIRENEIVAGLVVHLDTDILRRERTCETNAEVTRQGTDRAVIGRHLFLVVESALATRTCLAVPLFSNPAPGGQALDESKRRGSFDFWTKGTSRFSRWQHWRIPFDALIAASAQERTTEADRCTYPGTPPDFAKIVSWVSKNHAQFRIP